MHNGNGEMEIQQKAQQLLYWYRGGGWFLVARQLLRKLIGPIYRHEVQYVLMANPDANLDSLAAGRLRSCVVETVENFREIAAELPRAIPTKDLHTRLEVGCIIIFAYRQRGDNTEKEILGYSVCERGWISLLGHKKKVSPDILFTHYTEVLPQYRGLRTFQYLIAARTEYGKARDIKKYYSGLSSTNLSSYRGFMHAGVQIVGSVRQISLFNGLFVWETPWEKIEAMLADTKKE